MMKIWIPKIARSAEGVVIISLKKINQNILEHTIYIL